MSNNYQWDSLVNRSSIFTDGPSVGIVFEKGDYFIADVECTGFACPDIYEHREWALEPESEIISRGLVTW